VEIRSYLDFDLVIEQTGDRYRARVINSPAGQAAVEFDSLFSPLELENFVLRMGRPQRGMRRIDSTEMEAIKTFGTRLFRTVFNDDVYACYLRSIDNVLNQNTGLRIRLRINVPEFHDLPWEFLYNPQFDQFLALSKDTPIIRYIELPYTTQALPVRTPMKILVMISSPEGFPPLDIEEEWKKLNRALQPLINRGLVILERLEHPTLSALQQHLRRDRVHIFHFIGHGKYFDHKQEGMLLLEDENQRGRPTSGQHLGAILHDHHTLRLVVLNACEGARTSAEDPYTGVAQTLVRQGIPAVLAMQFEIFEFAAITLAQEFYSAIADGYPVDAALSEARKAIFASNNDVEWGTPVLFMRIPNGVLFRPETPAEKAARLKDERIAREKATREQAKREAEEKKAQEQRISILNRLYEQVKNQMTQRDWSAAIDFLMQIQRIDPDFRDVAALLEQAEAEQERAHNIEDLLTQGKEMIQNEDWSRAVLMFEQVLVLVPDHKEAQLLKAKTEAQIKQEQELQERQAEEQRQAQLIKLYEQASTKLAKEDWIGASKLLAEIDQTEPGFRDIKNLLKQAQTEKDRQEKFDGLVADGREYLEHHEWTQAIRVFEQALGLDSENIEALALLAEAKRGEKVKDLFDTAQKHMLAKQWSEAITKFESVLELEPAHAEAEGQLAEAKIKLAQQAEDRRKKIDTLPEGSISKSIRPASHSEEIKPLQPTSPPEEFKLRKKPKDLPK
jgi:outer membrane protein assembly factor BamD (BamD/ComL family)